MIELNKVYKGDYLNYMRSIPSESVDLVFSDPPFGVNWQSNFIEDEHVTLSNDDKEFSYLPLAIEAYRVLKQNTAALLFTGWNTYPQHFIELKQAGFNLKPTLVVQTRGLGLGDLQGSFAPAYSWLLMGTKGRFLFRQTNLVENATAGKCAHGPNSKIHSKITPKYCTRLPSAWFGADYPYATAHYKDQKKVCALCC